MFLTDDSLFVLPLNCPEIKSDVYQRSFQSEAGCMGKSSQGLMDVAIRSSLRTSLFLCVPQSGFVQSEKSIMKICCDKCGWKFPFIFNEVLDSIYMLLCACDCG